jgi:phosphoribosylglycinamide formyltransferase-1
MLNIAVLVSGGGTNLQSLINSIENGTIKNGRITCVIASREGVFALERARKHNIQSHVVARKEYKDLEAYGQAMLKVLKETNADLVVLAGFLSILSKQVTDAFPNKIINIHPALIPAFCGDGCYGLKVHEAVLKYGVKVTGATVHFVNEVTDGGAIILQKAVDVNQDDTPEILQQRVMQQAEWELLPKAVSLFCDGKISVRNGRVYIND